MVKVYLYFHENISNVHIERVLSTNRSLENVYIVASISENLPLGDNQIGGICPTKLCKGMQDTETSL